MSCTSRPAARGLKTYMTRLEAHRKQVAAEQKKAAQQRKATRSFSHTVRTQNDEASTGTHRKNRGKSLN